jgi:hypothetical protein
MLHQCRGEEANTNLDLTWNTHDAIHSRSGDIINRAKKFKSDSSKHVKSLKNLICKSYDLATIVDPEKTTDLSQVINKLDHIMLYTSP